MRSSDPDYSARVPAWWLVPVLLIGLAAGLALPFWLKAMETETAVPPPPTTTPSPPTVPSPPPPTVPSPSSPAPNASSLCQRVLASGNADGVGDEELVDCARRHQLGACVLFEKKTGWCPSCACPMYVQDANICSTDGNCRAPMNGSGCTRMPPAGCTKSDDVGGGACFLRMLLSQRLCDGKYFGD